MPGRRGGRAGTIETIALRTEWAEHGQVVLGDFEYLNPDVRDKPEFLAPSQQ